MQGGSGRLGRSATRIITLARQSLLNVLRHGSQQDTVPDDEPCSTEHIVENATIETDNAIRLRRRFKSSLYSTPYSSNRSIVSNIRKGVNNRRQAKMQRLQVVSEMVPDYFVHRIKFRRRVFSGVFTPDGKYFVTSTQDFTIRVFDGNRIELDRDEPPAVKKFYIPDCGWAILDVAIAPDGTRGAASSWGAKVHLFNINSDATDNKVQSLPIVEDSE